MLLTLYSTLLGLAALAALPLLPLLLLLPRARAGVMQRLGRLPRELREQALPSEGSLWVHAASLGEVNAVAPVLRELLPRLPRLGLIFTCTSPAGREQARRLFPQAACLLLPLDLPFLLGPWVRRFRPRLALIAETELWPNFLAQLKAQGAQVLLVNGRLSEGAYRRYRRLRPLLGRTLECLDLLAVQSAADAERYLDLGVRPARVLVTGNTKFDLQADPAAAREQGSALRRSLGWPAEAPALVAGSTRPGEEALLLKAFAELRRSLPQARLVLAPRHLERLGELEGLLKSGGWKWARRSGAKSPGAQVLLLDSLGELRAFYALACEGGAAWVGGSFAGHGGQNPLEPAALGVPAFFGLSMENFAEPAAALLASGGAFQVEAEGLAAATLALLRDAPRRRAAGEAAAECLRRRAGASRRAAELGLKLLLLARMRREGQAWREEGLAGFRRVSEFGAPDEPLPEPSAPAPAAVGEFGRAAGRESGRAAPPAMAGAGEFGGEAQRAAAPPPTAYSPGAASEFGGLARGDGAAETPSTPLPRSRAFGWGLEEGDGPA